MATRYSLVPYFQLSMLITLLYTYHKIVKLPDLEKNGRNVERDSLVLLFCASLILASWCLFQPLPSLPPPHRPSNGSAPCPRDASPTSQSDDRCLVPLNVNGWGSLEGREEGKRRERKGGEHIFNQPYYNNNYYTVDREIFVVKKISSTIFSDEN